MKFWVKFLLLYVVLILVIGCAFKITLDHFNTDYLVQRAATQKIAYAGVLQTNRLLADTYFNNVINQPDILEQVQKVVHSEGEEQRKQRGLLYRSLVATYKHNKKDVAEILHFHFPDNRSMLRFQLPVVSGDDLTEKRPSVQLCNSLLHEVHGFERGRMLHGRRHVYPLIYQQEHVGSVEVSQPFHLLYRQVQQLETAVKTHFSFFQSKKLMTGKLLKQEENLFVGGELHPEFVRQEWVSQRLAQSEQIDPIDEDILSVFEHLKNNDQTQQNLSRGADFSQFVKTDTAIYSVVFYSIKNISGQATGYLLGITPELHIHTLITRFYIAFFISATTLLGIFFYRGTLQTQLIEKKKTQKSLRAFFDNKLVAMVQFDADGNYTQVNQQWEEMTGYSRDELLTMNFRNLTHPDEFKRESLIDQFSESDTQQTFQRTKRYVCKDGSIFWGITSGTGLYDDLNQFSGMVGMIIDVTETKQAEEALRKSESLLSKSQEIAHIGSWELNLVTNRLTWSDEVYRIFGLRPQEVNSTYETFLSCLHPDDRTAVEAAYSESVQDGYKTYEIEHRIVRQDNGEVRIVHEKCEHIKGASGQIVSSIGMVQDITERKHAEEERERLLQAIDQSSETIVITDTEGTIQYTNPAFEEITGYTCKEAIGQNPRILKSDRQDKSFYEEMWKTLLRGETWSGQLINKKKDGTFYTEAATISPVHDASGSIINFVAVKRDISRYIVLEERVTTSEERLKKIVDQLPVVLWVLDNDGIFTLSEGSALKGLGLKPGQVVGQSALTLYDHFPEVRKAIQRALGGEAFSVQNWMNGAFYENHYSPLRDTEDAISGIICISIDITEAHQLQEEVSKRARLVSLGELAAGVAHEINNPNALVLLNSKALIKVFADIVPILDAHCQLNGDFSLGGSCFSEVRDELTPLLDHIFESAQRIKLIVSDLRCFASDDAKSDYELVDLNQMVKSTLPYVEHLICDSTDHFSISYSPVPLHVMGVSGRLEQVVINLLQNACQSLSDKSAKITLSLDHDEKNQRQVLKIKDEGCGINEEDLARIKEPFFTTRRNDGGTGLGIFVSRRIVLEYSGTLEFVSAPGVGTTAILSFPTYHKDFSE